MRKTISYIALMLSLLCLVCCNDKVGGDEIHTLDVVEPEGGISGPASVVGLDINMDFGDAGYGTKAGEWGPDAFSRKVTSVMIISRPYFERQPGHSRGEYRQMELDSWSKAKFYMVPARPDEETGVLSVKLRVPAGDEDNKVRFYILLNGSHHMVEAIEGRGMTHGLRLNRESIYTAQSVRNMDLNVSPSNFGQLTHDVISEFVSAEKGFAMMGICMAEKAGSAPVPYAEISQYVQNNVTLDVTMHRMVSRVLFTSSCYPVASESDPRYLKISGFEDYDKPGALLPNGDPLLPMKRIGGADSESQAGWMPLSSVHYCLNAVNTKVFLEHSEDSVSVANLYPMDPNYMLDEILEPDGNDWVFRTNDGKDPLYNYTNDFIYLKPDQADEMFALYHGQAQLPDWMKTALEYKGDMDYFGENTGADGETHTHGATTFEDGLYCLENTTSSISMMKEASVPLSSSFRRFIPKRAATHLLVEGRFVPRYVVTGRTGEAVDSKQVISRSATISEAEAVLVNATYGNGTFWTPDLVNFYSRSGMEAEIEYTNTDYAISQGIVPLHESDFVCYTGGWCTYSSYIAGKATPVEDGHGNTTTYADGISSVRRDGYYILTTSSVRVPSTESVMMEVNTTSRLRWPSADGTGSVIIKP